MTMTQNSKGHRFILLMHRRIGQSDRLQKFSDFRTEIRAIARLKRSAKEIKGLKTGSDKSHYTRRKTGS